MSGHEYPFGVAKLKAKVSLPAEVYACRAAAAPSADLPVN